MKLKFSLEDPVDAGVAHDVLVTLGTTASVGALADAIAACRPEWARRLGGEPTTLSLGGLQGRVLERDATVADAGMQSGQVVGMVPSEPGGHAVPGGPPAAVLTVLEGPEAGRTYPLPEGPTSVGRDRACPVRLSDPLVSKRHARINVSDVVEIVDLGSANGVEVGDGPVERSTLGPDDRVRVGDSVFRVAHSAGRAAAAAAGPGVGFNRSPVLLRRYDGQELIAPAVPPAAERAGLPLVPLLAPLLMGGVLFAITRQLVSVAFVALSPVMMVGSVFEARRSSGRAHRQERSAFDAELSTLVAGLEAAQDEQRAARRAEHPDLADLMAAAATRSAGLWSMRPGRPGWLELCVGIGRLPSRDRVAAPGSPGGAIDAQLALRAVVERFAGVDGVPVTCDLSGAGAVGVAGPRTATLGIARAHLARLVALHSPAELVVAAVVSSSVQADWRWLQWLPHAGSDHSPLPVEHLASSPAAALALVAALEEEVARRLEGADGGEPPPVPAVVVIVEDSAPVDRSRLVELAGRGAKAAVHLYWVAPSVERLPAACTTYVVHRHSGATTVCDTGAGTSVQVTPETLAAPGALGFARDLAPVFDAGARIDDDSDLPVSVALLGVVGPERASPDGSAVLEQWRTGGSLPAPAPAGGTRRRRPAQLRAVVGVAADRNLVLDLREHGPHALVGGTTGAGKSEFLQSWVMSMACEQSPARVTFLFVDYKGGSAFGECVKLPHSVGLVTDLTPHLVNRALTSLDAELRHRELILRRKQAKDLMDLEARGDPEAPPSLVIVVDEFAALVSEVPQFVDGVVNVAQRGRSLGLHLVLATQRPAGVIRDNLRANTNLRIALRMADAEDSTDVVGSPVAAGFDPLLPGRGIVKVGPGRLTPFQSGYLGGWTPDEAPAPPITIDHLGFASGGGWEPLGGAAVSEESGPNDLQRLVSAVVAANAAGGLDAPRRPWLDPLEPVYDLTRSRQSRNDEELVFGLIDEPAEQRQRTVAFVPDQDGNMAVFGTGGAGKSTFLRTLAVVAGLSVKGGPCHVYGLDFGTRGLHMLAELDHVGAVVTGDDTERVIRLLSMLRRCIDERAARYSALDAATIVEYRQRAGRPDEPRILVLVDSLGAFRQSYETGQHAGWFEAFQAIAAEGRPVGVHVVISADRAGAVPLALASVIQRRLVLRLAGETEYAFLGAPIDGLSDKSPPGRGFIGDDEVQVAVLGGSANTARQAAALRSLARQLRDATGRAPAPPVGRLPELVALEDLPVAVDGRPALGVSDDALAPIGFDPSGFFLVVGPPRSGRTTAVATAALSLRRLRPELAFVHLAMRPSPMSELLAWAAQAVGADEVAALVKDLLAELGSADGRGGLRAVVVLEDLASFAGTAAEAHLLDLYGQVSAGAACLITEAETSAVTTWSVLYQPVKAARHGIALQPDQLDGDAVFKTTFPRLARRDFPAGRGMYVAGGHPQRVQVALPEIVGPTP